LRWYFSQRTQLIHSIGPKTPVLGRFELFHYCTKLDAKLAELEPLTYKFAKRSCFGSFRKNEPDPLHWIQTHVLGRFGPFHYCTKLDAKLDELAPLTHKFVKRSCVAGFKNKRTRSTPLDPKLMFWGVSDRFVTTQNSMQNWLNWCY
jgi:hypothetical protein